METPIRLHQERCDLCDGLPKCVPACPQQVLAVRDRRIVMTHTDHCPPGCTDCIDVCPSGTFSLVEQVHQGLGAVPMERVEGPARIHHVAYSRGASEDEESIRGRFTELCDELAIPADNRSMGETRAHAWGKPQRSRGIHLQLVWELHTEYYFVRAVFTGNGDLKKKLEEIVPALHRAGRPPLVACLDIAVIDRPMGDDEVTAHLATRNRFGAKVLGGDLAVYTSYRPMEGRERYIVAGTPEAVEEHATFAVANIGRIENYYHLLMIPRQEVRDTVQELHRMERALGRRTEEVTAGLGRAAPEQMQAWLEALTVDLAQVVRVNARFSHVLSATFPYTELVREGFGNWKEEPLNGFSSLSGLILERTRSVAEEYRALLSRIERMEREISDLVAVLRTRVDMTMEAQNTQLLQNLDTRSAIQLRLQEMAEGLSVIVISYYTTGLAGYIFKALEKQHLIASATLPTALFIPVAVLTAFLVTRRGLTKLKRKEARGLNRDG